MDLMKQENNNFEHKELTYKIIGLCMEVHKVLGKGLLEIIYKDALEYELKSSCINFEREKKYNVEYKDIILRHQFNADFIIEDKIILEIKSCNKIIDEFVKQTLNYMGISKCKIGLLVNFGEASLKYQRLVL
jgi:GxxExxY protein